MPLLIVLDALSAEERRSGARELVRKALRRLIKRCEGEAVALLDAADLAGAEEGSAPQVEVGAGPEHLAKLMAKLNDSKRAAHGAAARERGGTWLRLLGAVSATEMQGQAADPPRVLFITDSAKDAGCPDFIQVGSSSGAALHVVLLRGTCRHCPWLSDLASASGGSYTVVIPTEEPDANKKRRRGQGEGFFQFTHIKGSAARGAAAFEPAAVSLQAAAARLGDCLSKLQTVTLSLGHLTCEWRLTPPLPETLCHPVVVPEREDRSDARLRPSLQLSILGFVAAQAFAFPLVTSSHVMFPVSSKHAFPPLLLASLKGEPHHEPLVAVVGLSGEGTTSNVGSLAALHLEPAPNAAEGMLFSLSLLHKEHPSLDWLLSLECQQPASSTFGDIGQHLQHDLLKAQRYARSLPSRQSALEETVAHIEAMAARYGAPGIHEALQTLLAGVAAEFEEREASEKAQKRQHNTRRQNAQATVSSQALGILQQMMDKAPDED